ncbi:MAG: preprotein translocase subunit SecA [Dictyoglomi bacterium]|nr:preprotein translocase subunit SecA [Dictyoglomota bacterium]HOK29290.1 preprotein translocase subunit SecA [bacterium]HOL54622.1 preprotein translocase subunit SecA [bacterium]
MFKLLEKFIGKDSDRELRRYWRIVEKINELEDEISRLSDEELAGKTLEFKDKLNNGATLDDVMVPAFAVVREVARRKVNMRPFDVQLIGAIVLHEGKIAEMKTGEGKTLVATMPAYLNALTGEGVHIVTVNDYLAKRDRYWMGPVYEALGLKVGLLQHDSSPAERRDAYNSDITYGTNTEFGFDYLRDNMALSRDELVQRGFNYAIVDEVDSILIDEARTPLIISGVADKPTRLYYQFAQIARNLVRDMDYTVDEKLKTVILTEAGVRKVEKMLNIDNLYEVGDIDYPSYLMAALKAKELFKKDVDYVIKDGEVIIVDEFTGRLMYGRRYSDGIHQAIEAKEGLKIRQEAQTLAYITLQNYFRMYKKLAGMTGTAATEADEFLKIYGLEVIVVPTHKPMIRIDYPDAVYKTEKAKVRAIINEIAELYKMGRPVLVGTRSIEKSELLSSMLKRLGIPHQVLNAKYHEKEAEIIANAGQKGSVTIATNMAGRGVDIVLGDGVVELGGLHIIGTERHESRRIDNQLRGRAGRQGDPGSSRFYISLEDELMRLFGSDKIRGVMDKLGVDEDQPIEHSIISKAIENAQKKVESYHFDIRKQLLEYDDVMETQRKVIYGERKKILEGEDLKSSVISLMNDCLLEMAEAYIPKNRKDLWNIEGFISEVKDIFDIDISTDEIKESSYDEIVNLCRDRIVSHYDEKEKRLGSDLMRQAEIFIMLRALDTHWIEHLENMDSLKEGIGLRAYGQREPLIEYKREAYEMFQYMLSSMRRDISRLLMKLEIKTESIEHKPVAMVSATHNNTQKKSVKVKKIGRNDPCPCGSGKKYKYCCGRDVS